MVFAIGISSIAGLIPSLNVSAATYNMCIYNLVDGVENKSGITLNDGTYKDSSPLVDGAKSVLLTSDG